MTAPRPLSEADVEAAVTEAFRLIFTRWTPHSRRRSDCAKKGSPE